MPVSPVRRLRSVSWESCPTSGRTLKKIDRTATPPPLTNQIPLELQQIQSTRAIVIRKVLSLHVGNDIDRCLQFRFHGSGGERSIFRDRQGGAGRHVRTG